MDNLSSTVAKLLDAVEIAYAPHEEHIWVELPSGFGTIEIGEIDNKDSIIGLVGHGWHTHGGCLVPEYGEDIPLAIVAFLVAIFNGELKMVEFQLPGGEPRRIVTRDLESFMKSKHLGEIDKVFETEKTPNKTFQRTVDSGGSTSAES